MYTDRIMDGGMDTEENSFENGCFGCWESSLQRQFCCGVKRI